MAVPPQILGLYFYRAAHPVAGPDADFNDASCRPDPDFDHGTIGLCRPGLRSKAARLARDYGPVDLLFYADGPDASSIALVALARVGGTFPDHQSARPSFSGMLPSNLMLPGNPCLLGTAVDAETGRLLPSTLPSGCSCDYYVGRAGTTYIKLDRETMVLRRENPLILPLRALTKLAPRGIGSRWPENLEMGTFNRGTQNGARWLREPAEARALRDYFLNRATTTQGATPDAAHLAQAAADVAQQAERVRSIKRRYRRKSC